MVRGNCDLVVDGKMLITRNHLIELAPTGQLTRQQTRELELTWPLQKGWRKQLCAMYIDFSFFDYLVSIRDETSKAR